MKLFTRISALFLIFTLVLSMSISVMAVDFDNMYDGFEYAGEDTTVNITVSSDEGNRGYVSLEGKTYNISAGEGGSLTHVTLDGYGTVNINMDVAGVATFDGVELTVHGNVTDGAFASDDSFIMVDGNVSSNNVNGATARNDGAIVIYGDVTSSQTGLSACDSSCITVFGDVTGGQNGVLVKDEATVRVTGSINASNSDGIDITLGKSDPDKTFDPHISAGAYDNISAIDLTEQELQKAKENIVILPTPTNAVPVADAFWDNLIFRIARTQPGEEITIDASMRASIPAAVIDAVRDSDITLIVQWVGGEDLIITKSFAQEVTGYILLRELAEMLT